MNKIVKINQTELIDRTYFNYGSVENKSKLTWTDVPGWFSHFNSYRSFVEEVHNEATIVEIGTFLGRSTCCMGELIKNSGKNIKFYAIDTFSGSIGEDWHTDIITQISNQKSTLYEQFLCYLNACEVSDYVTPIQASSLKASLQFKDESLDVIFVDGGHTYEEVLSDIIAWYPKLKKGGIIAGDDYNTWDEVTSAVNEYFKNKNIEVIENNVVWKHKKI